MCKILITVVLSFGFTILHAQEYRISFAAEGASNKIDNVKIENLTKGTSLTISGSNVLILKSSVTGIASINYPKKEIIRIYPNPMIDYSNIVFEVLLDGVYQIEVCNIFGKKIFEMQRLLTEGRHIYRISGLQTGSYIVKINNHKEMFIGKLISFNNEIKNPNMTKLEFIQSEISAPTIKEASLETEMQYNDGDRLKFTGISEHFSTVISDIPSKDKIIVFNFIECTDSDGNNYPIVKIGEQTWMAKNLAYLPQVYRGNEGGLIYGYYVYDYNGFGIVDAKKTQNYKTLGVLYNWHSAFNGGLKSKNNPEFIRGVCPENWHLPSDEEWEKLASFVSLDKGPFSKSGDDWQNVGIHLKDVLFWWNKGDGYDDYGFTGLPAGYRSNSYSYFTSYGYTGLWWSSTKASNDNAYIRQLNSGNSFERKSEYKSIGCCVRCIKD